MSGPAFPYPSDEWIGQPSDDPKNHSGCYGDPDKSHVKTWQDKMFQAEKNLAVDGDVGPQTWKATWNAPVTDGGGGGGSGGGSGGGGGGSGSGSGTDRRNQALKWMANHRGLTEDPVNSNCDSRNDGIRKAQDDCAGGGTWLRNQPWCGVWCFNALEQAGGVQGLDSNMASVAWIEQQAKAGRDPFSSWTTDGDNAEPGDLVVLFGHGQHVGMVREVHTDYVVTEEGNTSVGSNGGSAQKQRSRHGDTYGYARVNYHGA